MPSKVESNTLIVKDMRKETARTAATIGLTCMGLWILAPVMGVAGVILAACFGMVVYESI